MQYVSTYSIQHILRQHKLYLDLPTAPFDHPTDDQDEPTDLFTGTRKIRAVSILKTCLENKTIYMHVSVLLGDMELTILKFAKELKMRAKSPIFGRL